MGWGCGLMLCLSGFDCWVSFASVFSCICCWVLILVSSPFYISICIFKWMMHRWFVDLSRKPNIYLSWFTSEIRVRLAPSNKFRPTSNFFTGCSFVDLFCYLNFISVMLSCLFFAALWSPAGTGLTSWLSLRDIFFRFATFLCGFLGQVWHLIASITELCFLPYLVWSTIYLYAIIMVTGDYT